MPFDSATEPKLRGTPVRRYRGEQAKAHRAADALHFVIRKFESGEWPWTQGECSPRWPHKGICAGYAVRRVKNQFGIKNDIVYDYVARAVEREIWLPDVCEISFEAIIWYNDTRGRTYPQVMSVLRTARDLALKEAGDL
jgi:hypothetical protein